MKKLVVTGVFALALVFIPQASFSCGAEGNSERRIFWEEDGEVKSAPFSPEVSQQLKGKGFLLEDCTRCNDSSKSARMPDDKSVMNKADLACLSYDIARDAKKDRF